MLPTPCKLVAWAGVKPQKGHPVNLDWSMFQKDCNLSVHPAIGLKLFDVCAAPNIPQAERWNRIESVGWDEKTSTYTIVLDDADFQFDTLDEARAYFGKGWTCDKDICNSGPQPGDPLDPADPHVLGPPLARTDFGYPIGGPPPKTS